MVSWLHLSGKNFNFLRYRLLPKKLFCLLYEYQPTKDSPTLVGRYGKGGAVCNLLQNNAKTGYLSKRYGNKII